MATKEKAKIDTDAIYAAHPQWRRLMDKEIVALVETGEVDQDEAVLYMGARRFRKYSD